MSFSFRSARRAAVLVAISISVLMQGCVPLMTAAAVAPTFGFLKQEIGKGSGTQASSRPAGQNLRVYGDVALSYDKTVELIVKAYRPHRPNVSIEKDQSVFKATINGFELVGTVTRSGGGAKIEFVRSDGDSSEKAQKAFGDAALAMVKDFPKGTISRDGKLLN